MSAGKGDTPRLVNQEVYGKNYDNIFRRAMSCSRCGSYGPNKECYVCYEPSREDEDPNDYDDAATWGDLDDEG